MAVILVLAFSILMQFSAAIYSIYLLKRFGGRLVWLTLASALMMMAIRRSMSLYSAINLYPDHPQSFSTELVALFISALVLVAVIALRPLIEKVTRSERKLAEETERNNIILESSPDGFCITDLSGVIEEVNPAYCKMLNMDAENLLGKNFYNFISPHSNYQSQHFIEEILNEGQSRFEVIQNDSCMQPVFTELTGRYVSTGEHEFIYLFLRDITERKVAENALNQFKSTLDRTLDSVFMFNPVTLNFTYANAGALKHIGYSQNDLYAMTPVDIKPEFNLAGFREFISPMLQGEHNALSFETVHEDVNGKIIPVEIFLQYVLLDNNESQFIAVVRDITERMEAQAMLHAQKEKALVTLAAIGDGVITTSLTGTVEYMNKAAEAMCGIHEKEAKHKELLDVCQLVDELSHKRLDDPVILAMLKGGSIYLSHNVVLLSHDNNTIYSVEVVVSPIFDNEQTIMGAVIVLHDVTELRGMAQKLSYQATHDSLTGLMNRREFESRLTLSLHKFKKENIDCVLFYMDLDQFKIVNDTCGHIAGDDMLIKITKLLENCMRESDALARLGGDEFGVLLNNCSVEQALIIARKVHHALGMFRFAWKENIFEVGVSIGIVPIDTSVVNISDLLSAADSACYVAKERGRNTEHVYVSGDKALVHRHGQMKWYQRIQRALDNNQFCLYMQTIRALRKNEVSHVEILLRMTTDEGEIISPVQFFPTAERYHMAIDLDRWVLKNVFAAINMQNSRLYNLEGLCSINLSGQSLGEADFMNYVVTLFDDYKIDGSMICFEVTETAVISNITQARTFMSVMRGMGCSFSLDDFGSGLSSFSYLKNLNVDYLKIDGSFVRNILHDSDDLNMVTTINYLAHSLGLKTVAEFVENEELITALEKMGLDFLQGYAIDIPSPVFPA